MTSLNQIPEHLRDRRYDDENWTPERAFIVGRRWTVSVAILAGVVSGFIGYYAPPLTEHWALAAVAMLRQETVTGPVAVYGQGYTAPLAIYAGVLEARITEIVLAAPPASHEDPAAPEFLGVLRIGDLPHNLALAYPRPITFVGNVPEAYTWTRRLYEKLGAGDQIRVIRSMGQWRPR